MHSTHSPSCHRSLAHRRTSLAARPWISWFPARTRTYFRTHLACTLTSCTCLISPITCSLVSDPLIPASVHESLLARSDFRALAYSLTTCLGVLLALSLARCARSRRVSQVSAKQTWRRSTRLSLCSTGSRTSVALRLAPDRRPLCTQDPRCA